METFDHVVLCEVFNAKVQGATKNMKSVLRTLFQNAGRTLQATGLAASSRNKQYDLNYPELYGP